ncbi:MAG: sialidase family protein, partial [Candidatus Poribacteria bacterium]|nr:sialidase family protein [Candidatus Poribacteria bacterium]
MRRRIRLLLVLIGFVAGLLHHRAAVAVPPQWSPTEILSSGGSVGDVASVSVAAFGSNVYVVWSDARLGARRLFLRQSVDFGATWGAEELIPTPAGTHIEPSIVANAQTLFLAWTFRESSTNSDIWHMRRTASGWGAPVRVSVSGNASAPSIARTRAFPETIAVAFERGATGQRQIVIAY